MTPAPEQPKRGRGRPAGSTIPEAERKTRRLVVLLSPADDDKARDLGGPDWVREQIRRAKVPA